MSRLARGVAAVGVATAALLAGPALQASAQDVASDYVVAGSVEADGTLHVASTITFDGAAPAQLVQRLDTTRSHFEFTTYHYVIDDVKATAGGQDLAPAITDDGDFKVVTIDTSKAGNEPIEISYTVKGAAVAGEPVPGSEATTTTVTWPVLQGLSVGVAKASGEITVPGIITSINCRAGAPQSPGPCKLWAGGTHDAQHPYFETGAVGANGIIELTFGAPSNSIAPNADLREEWTLDRAFSTETGPLLTALGALLLGGAALWFMSRTFGRDATTNKDPQLVADFVPTGAGEASFKVYDDVRPGHVGTVIDEDIDPVDVTASVIDLAVRGHMRIHELGRKNVHAPLDWQFERLQGTDALAPYEQTLLDALAPAGGEGVIVSQISEPVEEVIEKVQDQLYDEVVQRGWFAKRPDDTRNQWSTIGWVAVALAVAALIGLMIFTKFGLLGLVLIGLAVGLVWVADHMPRRTAKGASMLAGLEALRMQLHTQPTEQLPKANTYQEISRVLPYAVVLGGKRRWLQAMVAADTDATPDPHDLAWYHADGDWEMEDLPDALSAFVSTMQGELYGRH